jgi:hypothetical protein
VTVQSYFIVSCARSGSTSLAQILNRATNGRCETEPVPDLNRECRDSMDGRLAEDPEAVLERTVVRRVRAAAGSMAVYGEKHVTYGPFLRLMHRRLGCKFIYLKRDGRDVVRSLMDWHNLKFGTIYREAADVGGESETARLSAANLPAHFDTSDYARPRPRPGEPLYAEWEGLTRFEMCAYYWARINDLYLTELSRLPPDSWITLDYRRPTAADVLRAAAFVGLVGLEPDVVAGMLNEKINSVSSRTSPAAAGTGRGDAAPLPEPFPNWKAWTTERTAQFDRLAGAMMRQIGYAAD